LWTTEKLGSGTWMTDGDVAKLRMNYECDGRKLVLIQSLLRNNINYLNQ
jgi:hypothetical protein